MHFSTRQHTSCYFEDFCTKSLELHPYTRSLLSKGLNLEVQPFGFLHLVYTFSIQEAAIKICEDTRQCFFADLLFVAFFCLQYFVVLVSSSEKQKHDEVVSFWQVQKLFG